VRRIFYHVLNSGNARQVVFRKKRKKGMFLFFCLLKRKSWKRGMSPFSKAFYWGVAER